MNFNIIMAYTPNTGFVILFLNCFKNFIFESMLLKLRPYIIYYNYIHKLNYPDLPLYGFTV